MRFTRVTLFFIAFIIALGFYQLASHFLSDVEPQTFQATEEAMIDIANVLAEFAESDFQKNPESAEKLHAIFDGAHDRKFEARIFDHLKSHVGLNVYVTDASGKVIFDSQHRRVGQDYSGRRDVAFTLRGVYGARSTRENSDDSSSSVLYVSAPIGDPTKPSGVLTVYKPQADALPMIYKRRKVIYRACALIGGGILFLIGVVFLWLFHPIGKITEYARAIERGERPKLPKLGIGREVNTLAHALESMREALEGRNYVRHYIQTLTHEMKSPLAAIKGAAELMDENMPPETRKRFLENIRAETSRTERLINRLLELSAIEGMTHVEAGAPFDFRSIISRAIDQARPLAELSSITLETQLPEEEIMVAGDTFVLRAAVTNLIENSIDFSPESGTVHISLQRHATFLELHVRDHGPGIPAYAREKVFDRFYSLRHHTVGRKGTGLGLTLVREAASVHSGSIRLEAPEDGGTLAVLTLPLAG